MKSRAPRRGSTLLTALGVTLLIALIILGALAYTGAEQERSGRSVRDIDAQTCSESAAQWGRKFYGEAYPRWNQMLSATTGARYNNPESKLENIADEWGAGSYGRIDGQTVRMPDRPPDFRVTLSDNIDEFPPNEPNPTRDNDLQVVIRAECLIPRLAIATPKVVENLEKKAEEDPNHWRGPVLSETNETRKNKVVEVVLIHTPGNEYRAGQRGGGSSGDQNIYN
ncbi:hypothetical protein ATI61_10138 [Archangium gephyra]|uniref:Uncharacterized protein n=1 Tax=Archangium gephyra TaxID=48 RepID=A0AAC8QCQ1_9BACT|nr:hypothetical protein [Archangium gephyra]AKJ04895.1 Hypothetical protein AA314_06521 [Archangium gephyra]REG37064.1 hypothetical protein ATI61_10138 [Archangium gephyra]